MRTISCFALLALALLSTRVDAQRNPYDTETRRLEREVVRSGRSARGVLPLLRLVRFGGDTSPGTTKAALERIARNRRVAPPLRALATAYGARFFIDAGEPGRAEETYDELGYLRDWRIMGPFDNEGRGGYSRELPPEAARNRPVDLNASFRGREREVRWRTYPKVVDRYGYVNLDAVMRPWVNVCSVAETFVRVDRARPMSLWLGAGGAAKVYFNGERVLEDDVYRAATFDRQVALVGAREGWNRILIKNCVNDRSWGFYLRMAEADGSPPQNIEVNPTGATEAATAPSLGLGEPPLAPFAALQKAVEDDAESARAHYDLARYLMWTESDNPDEQRARQLAERAATLDDRRVEHLLLAASLAPSRAERMRFAAQAEERAARDPRVRMLRASLIRSGPDAGRALRMLDLPMNTMAGMRAAAQRATMYQQRGLQLSALNTIEAALAQSGGAYSWQRLRVAALDRLGRREAALGARRELIQVAAGDMAVRSALLSDAIERGETDAALAQIDAMRASLPGAPNILRRAASVFEGLGRQEDALAIHRQLIALTPEEASYHQEYGYALLRFGHRGPAIEAFRETLALRPQDPTTRQLLETLRPTERRDEAYATDIDDILERREAQSNWSATILHDLSVNTVYESGLHTEFRQIAYQVHNEEAARRWNVYSIPYEPGLQWVDIRSARVHRADGSVVESIRTGVQNLGDPRYRIYYDTRALVVRLPDLQPGDTVELRYRVEDVSRRNAFNDYYGSFRLLQRTQPIRHLEHVLITPKSRAIHLNSPQLPSLRHQRSEDGDLRIDRFTATNIEAIRRESRTPGATEIAPYLHVSTYGRWEDVGRWWWGLAEEQLHPDDSLRETVRELTDGVSDTRTKVQRIYNWVIRNTRYVGLEFGIHGFKPYRVTQVVERGFGDCKDKASLLYTMFTLAGIDARIALIRTRDNGLVDDEPASLAVFNHAIAYVPELDLFLDGTAETHGIDELPFGDQGAMTLLVGPNSVELRQTPVLPANRERRERQIEASLAGDGSANVEVTEEVRGSSAARYRSLFEAEGSRRERLQRLTAGTFPGIEIVSETFSDLADFERPVEVRYQARVPQFAQRSGRQLQVASSTLGNLLRAFAPSPRRRYPLELGARNTYVERRTIRLPARHRVTHVPSGGEAASPFGRLSVRYEQRGNAVNVRSELEIQRDRVSVEEYPAFRQWVERANALIEQRITVGGPQ